MSALDTNSSIYPSQVIQIAAIQWDKAPNKIPDKYSDYVDVFSSDLVKELPGNTSMNKHDIKPVKGIYPL